jgi:hypothetical protein
VTETLWVPWATRQTWAGYSGGTLTGSARKITLHTTETLGWPSYGAGASAPHLTLNPATGEARQHIALNRSARALASPGAPTSPNMNAGSPHIQIEIIGYASQTPNYSDAWYRKLAEWVKWLCDDWRVPVAFPFVFIPSPSGATRQSWSTYAPANGIVGHQHAPFNNHWDPGGIDVARLRKFMAEGTVDPDPGKEESDVGEYIKGLVRKSGTVTIPRGQEFTLLSLPAGPKGQAALYNAQIVIESGRGPLRAKQAKVRFVRMPQGDGTGEQDYQLTPGRFRLVHNHAFIAGSRVELRILVPGRGSVKIRYAIFKGVLFG